MGDKKHSQTSGAARGSLPISQHPLFPAIVALWFGAAFGLASLALRPAMVEQFVVAMGIDKVIPMAAPPLGTTTRILLSLGLTALGGIIGSLVARRMARPAADPRERRRGAFRQDQTDHATAPTPAMPEARQTIGARRRSLAIDDTSEARPLSDRARVPGQEARILNVAEFDLDGFEEAAAQASDVIIEAPDAMAASEPFIAPVQALIGAEPTIDAGFAPSEEAGDEAVTVSIGRDHDFNDMDEALAAPFQTDGTATPPEARAADTAPTLRGLENKLIATYAREIKARADQGARAGATPLFGTPAPVSDTHATLLPRMNLGNWGEDEHGDDQRSDPTAIEQEPAPLFDAPSAETGAMNEAEPRTLDDNPDAPPANDPRSGAEKISAAQLDTLSHVELLERLAIAMEQQRRLAAATVEQTMAERDAVPEAPSEPAVLPEAGMTDDAFDMPFVAKASELLPDDTADAPVTAQDAADADEEPAFVSSDGRDHGETVVEASSPGAFETISVEAATIEPASVEPDATGPAPFAAPALPAAMRPVSFHDAGEDEVLPGYHPPRHIALSSDTAADGETDDDDVLEAGYSSLLDLSRPVTDKPRFVRIEEPESATIEPVVIFPGEAARMAAPFAGPTAHPQPAGDDATSADAAQDLEAPRRFDPPGASAKTAPHASPADTEKALRAALATLQRMSGAA